MVGTPNAPMAELLTDAERKALALTGELANLVHSEVIVGPQEANDWNEFAQRIHAVQHMIMAQAAARAYPDEFRLLGTTITSDPRLESQVVFDGRTPTTHPEDYGRL